MESGLVVGAYSHVTLCVRIWNVSRGATRVEEGNDDGLHTTRPPSERPNEMALRARYGPGNRIWSYQRAAEDSADGAPPPASVFGRTVSADEAVEMEADAPTQTAADAARATKRRGEPSSRGRKPSAARRPPAEDAPRRRSGRVPAPPKTHADPAHTALRTAKRKRSAVPDAPDAAPDALDAPPPDENTADDTATRTTRAATTKRPRVSHKDIDIKPRDDPDDSRRTTFGSTTTAPDPFTALSAADLASDTDHPQAQPPATTDTHDPTLRRLPSGVPVHRALPGLYRRYPISQVGLPKDVLVDVPDLDTNVALPPTTIPNAAPFLNLYAPRRTRGIGADKHGLCPICAEPPSRGGRGKAMMLNMKTSAFNYHMQYVHGLSPKTGLPFSPPIAFRSTPRKTVGAREKATLEEGLCHACTRWIIIEGVKAVDVLVPEIYWWKHASTCHKSRMLDGEGDFYIEDPLFKRILQWQRDHPAAPGREPTRSSNANGVRKEEPMEVDLHDSPVARQGAVTPVHPNPDEPDSSPLSSLDGTDGTRVSPVRKVSASALQLAPSARGPFGPPSPTARSRSVDAAAALSRGNSMVPALPGANSLPLGTPQLVNHALPGTLPGTPQTTASATPVIPGTTLPTVSTDTESRSVVDSGVELSPRDQARKLADAEDGDGDGEGEDEDAEGEDDPTATAENTPVIPQLPVLTAAGPGAEAIASTEQEQGLRLEAGQELASHAASVNALPDSGQGSIGDEQLELASSASEAQAPEQQVDVDALMQDAPSADIANSVVEQAQIPSLPLEAVDPVENDVPPAPATSTDILTRADSAELPAVQGVDMYAGNNTPNGQEAAPLALTDEDLALTTGLADAEMSLVGEEAGITGGALEMPSETLEPLATATVPSEQPLVGQELVPPISNVQAAGLSSGEGTPNTGGEADIFAFWNA
ncbi:Cell surface glycoprotein 1 [Ceratobasidium theobromae]|uniref:Cell surface glycoprotein 1 n=1 Tax=Ceratobasidium theobromae TaxID=1582974 RepID=A0A5N5QM35_9AGAM|nr:Cell surface glycoprotein 1 [Ceratobasidium theobromae]